MGKKEMILPLLVERKAELEEAIAKPDYFYRYRKN